MAGANIAGIINVFGEDGKQRIKSCEFHFKDHRNKMSKKLDSESAETFKSICNSLLECTTSTAYDDALRKMDDFINEKKERLPGLLGGMTGVGLFSGLLRLKQLLK